MEDLQRLVTQDTIKMLWEDAGLPHTEAAAGNPVLFLYFCQHLNEWLVNKHQLDLSPMPAKPIADHLCDMLDQSLK